MLATLKKMIKKYYKKNSKQLFYQLLPTRIYVTKIYVTYFNDTTCTYSKIFLGLINEILPFLGFSNSCVSLKILYFPVYMLLHFRKTRKTRGKKHVNSPSTFLWKLPPQKPKCKMSVFCSNTLIFSPECWKCILRGSDFKIFLETREFFSFSFYSKLLPSIKNHIENPGFGERGLLIINV